MQNSAGARLGTTPTQLALSSKESASCVVQRDQPWRPYVFLSISRYIEKSPIRLNGQKSFSSFHPARSAMFFKSLSGWLFLKHAVRFFPDCKSGFFPRGYSHSARMDFHGWKEAQEACLRGRTDNPENVSKEYPRYSICIIFISSVRMAP